jgi:hypothetical protein
LDPKLIRKRMYSLLPGPDPLPTDIKRTLPDLLGPSAPTNPIARLDNHDRRALGTKLARRTKPRQPGSHNHNIRPLTHRRGYSTRLGGLLNFGDYRAAASTPRFRFDVERLIDDENLIAIGKGKQVRWRVREQPWVLPRVQLHNILGAGSASDREVSHARSVGAGYSLAIEKDGKIATVLRSYDEGSEPAHGLASQRDLHRRRIGHVDGVDLP